MKLKSRLPVAKGLSPIHVDWEDGPFKGTRAPSAVMVLLVEYDHLREAEVVLIRRATNLSSHRGQIGFPGGRREIQDPSPVATALREAQEEIGLNPRKVEILGQIQNVASIDGSFVKPILGRINADDLVLKANPDEVQSIHLIPWTQLSSQNCRQFQFNMFGCWRNSFQYDCGSIMVWGLSAQMLHLFDFGDLA
ncbi:MAG: CoA pyrophosphatase [Proteobacteria bacterium]|nr:CoA pyrophosphatase [Pseudomonadota bacterium]